MTDIVSEYPGVLSTLHVDEGSKVEEGERIAEIELMKTMFPLVAPASGVIRFRVQLGEVVSAGDVIGSITEG